MNRMMHKGIGLAFALCLLVGLMPARAADAASAQSQAAQALKQDATCTRCHDEESAKPILQMYQTRHGVRADARTPTCQSCHGKSEKHLAGAGNDAQGSRPSPDIVFKTGQKGGKVTAAAEQSESCLACHKEGKRAHWDGSQHQTQDVACSSCHNVHVKADRVLSKATQAEVCFSCHKTERAQTHRNSTHPLDAGKMACSDCHNPHGSVGPKLLVKASVNETCYTCHAEKRGPFLWEHSPVADDCTNCHTPHGSVSNNLLKARPPFLCQECHQDHGSSLKSGNSVPAAAGSPSAGLNSAAALNGKYLTVQGNGRACLSCHVMVHGSNSPNGAKFNR